MTKRKEDSNGWFEIKGNPISKVGVFEYSGAQIGAQDKTRIYKVYRPEEELSNSETIESFKLLPFINDHEMLGPNVGISSAEEKGIDGVIGENVYFEAPYLKANIKVFSEELRNQIEAGKVDLSCGYCCEYEFTPGTYKGQHYDAIQRRIRGNHLALVEEGRMGKDVRVLDHLKLELDTKDKQKMEKQELLAKLVTIIKTIEDGIKSIELGKSLSQDEEAIINTLSGDAFNGVIQDNDIQYDDIQAQNVSDFEEITGDENEDLDTSDDDILAPSTDDDDIIDEIVNEVVGDEDIQKTNGMDAALRNALKKCGVKLLKAKHQNLHSKGVMDARSLVNEIAKRDSLANRLSNIIGSFDHSTMTAQDVANYGAKKLGLKVRGRAAIVAVDSYLVADKRLSNKNMSVGQDNRIRSSALSNYLKGHK